MSITAAEVSAPFGSLVVHATPEGLVSVDLSLEQCAADDEAGTPLLLEAVRQFRAYFQDGAFEFSLPLVYRGTSHQCRVWHALREIPSGMTVSYATAAERLGSGPRAVAAACRANPLPLVIPCHRVVGLHNPGGYCGHTEGRWLEVKQWLLQHERRPAAR